MGALARTIDTLQGDKTVLKIGTWTTVGFWIG
jgi:hypothetical protein